MICPEPFNDRMQFAFGDAPKDQIVECRFVIVGLSNEIDDASSPYKAIVSVLMLKECWDVRNVTTIVGLRTYQRRKHFMPWHRPGLQIPTECCIRVSPRSHAWGDPRWRIV